MTEAFQTDQILIYQPKDRSNLEARLEAETIWLTQKPIALLFGTQRPVIAKHLKNISNSGQLDEKLVSPILEQTTKHGAIKGKTQTTKGKYYSLFLKPESFSLPNFRRKKN